MTDILNGTPQAICVHLARHLLNVYRTEKCFRKEAVSINKSGVVFKSHGFWVDLKVKLRVKVDFSLEQATKAERGSRGIALHFLQPRR